MDDTTNTTTNQGHEEEQVPQRPQRPSRPQRPRRPPPDPNGQTRARTSRAPRPTPNSDTETPPSSEAPDPTGTPPIPRRTRTSRPPRVPRSPAELEAAARAMRMPPPDPTEPEPQVTVEAPPEPETALAIEKKPKKRKPTMPPSPIVEVAAEDIPEQIEAPPNTEAVEKTILNIALILFTNIAISFFHISSLALMEFSKTGNAIGFSGLAFVCTTTLLPILLANFTARSLLKFASPQVAMPALWDWVTTILLTLHFLPHFLNAIGFSTWYIQQMY